MTLFSFLKTTFLFSLSTFFISGKVFLSLLSQRACYFKPFCKLSWDRLWNKRTSMIILICLLGDTRSLASSPPRREQPQTWEAFNKQPILHSGVFCVGCGAGEKFIRSVWGLCNWLLVLEVKERVWSNLMLLWEFLNRSFCWSDDASSVIVGCMRIIIPLGNFHSIWLLRREELKLSVHLIINPCRSVSWCQQAISKIVQNALEVEQVVS